jgi:uncharacterized SAM-dependent methyltransferase
MFLRSLRDQSVHIGEVTEHFTEGEVIHTENSFKYDPEEFIALARRGGFETATWWTDEGERFGLFLLRAV